MRIESRARESFQLVWRTIFFDEITSSTAVFTGVRFSNECHLKKRSELFCNALIVNAITQSRRRHSRVTKQRCSPHGEHGRFIILFLYCYEHFLCCVKCGNASPRLRFKYTHHLWKKRSFRCSIHLSSNVCKYWLFLAVLVHFTS